MTSSGFPASNATAARVRMSVFLSNCVAATLCQMAGHFNHTWRQLGTQIFLGLFHSGPSCRRQTWLTFTSTIQKPQLALSQILNAQCIWGPAPEFLCLQAASIQTAQNLEKTYRHLQQPFLPGSATAGQQPATSTCKSGCRRCHKSADTQQQEQHLLPPLVK